MLEVDPESELNCAFGRVVCEVGGLLVVTMEAGIVFNECA